MPSPSLSSLLVITTALLLFLTSTTTTAHSHGHRGRHNHNRAAKRLPSAAGQDVEVFNATIAVAPTAAAVVVASEDESGLESGSALGKRAFPGSRGTFYAVSVFLFVSFFFLLVAFGDSARKQNKKEREEKRKRKRKDF
jgi:hypothetical protein